MTSNWMTMNMSVSCNDLLAVLNGCNIYMSGTHGLGNFPRSADRNIFALFDWYAVTHWGRNNGG